MGQQCSSPRSASPSDEAIKLQSSQALRPSGCIDPVPRENSLVHLELVLAQIMSTWQSETIVSPFLLPEERELAIELW